MNSLLRMENFRKNPMRKVAFFHGVRSTKYALRYILE